MIRGAVLALLASAATAQPNTPPTITPLADLSIVASGTSDPLQFTVTDAETSAANLNVSAVSSDTALVPHGNIFLSVNMAAPSTRFVCVTPEPNLTGAATITLTVSDAGGLTASRSFVLTVRPPAPPPLVPKLAITRSANGVVQLDWHAENGAWYQVEVSEDLTTWRPAGAAIKAASWSEMPPLNGAKRFYRLRPLGAFTVVFTGNNFTYTDADRTVTGIFRKPNGDGPFPACIISHGQGGSAAGYSASKANEFLPWGLGSIAPNYSHQANGDPSPVMSGFSPENLARGVACRNLLATLPWVDGERVVLWGHSKGAWLSIGLAGVISESIRAAGISAGGIVPDSFGVNQAAPTTTQASTVRAPWIMFHGAGDTVVPASQSVAFRALLDSLGVPEDRIEYDTTLHNLHQNATFNGDMLMKYRAWLQTHGVLP